MIDGDIWGLRSFCLALVIGAGSFGLDYAHLKNDQRYHSLDKRVEQRREFNRYKMPTSKYSLNNHFNNNIRLKKLIPKRKKKVLQLSPQKRRRNKIRKYILDHKLWENMNTNPYSYIVPAALVGWVRNVHKFGGFYSATIKPRNPSIQRRFKIPTYIFRSSINPHTRCVGLQIIKPWSYNVDESIYAQRLFHWLRNKTYLSDVMKKDYINTMFKK